MTPFQTILERVGLDELPDNLVIMGDRQSFNMKLAAKRHLKIYSCFDHLISLGIRKLIYGDFKDIFEPIRALSDLFESNIFSKFLHTLKKSGCVDEDLIISEICHSIEENKLNDVIINLPTSFGMNEDVHTNPIQLDEYSFFNVFNPSESSENQFWGIKSERIELNSKPFSSDEDHTLEFKEDEEFHEDDSYQTSTEITKSSLFTDFSQSTYDNFMKSTKLFQPFMQTRMLCSHQFIHCITL